MILHDDDLQMLPDWVQAGTYSVQLAEWLLSNSNEHFRIDDNMLIRIKQQNYYYLYYIQLEDELIPLTTDMKFCGLFGIQEFSLYMVGFELTYMVGFSADYNFPDKASIQAEVEQLITNEINVLIRSEWDQIRIAAGSKNKKNYIPAVDRKEIEWLATQAYLVDKDIDLFLYDNQFKFGAVFPEKALFQYLQYKERYVAEMAWKWINKNAAFLIQQKIIYGCIREAFDRITNSGTKSRVKRIKRLRGAISPDWKSVKVILKKNNMEYPFTMPAQELMNIKGEYSVKAIPPKERCNYFRIFGKHTPLEIQHISQVTYRNQCLYDSNQL